MWLAGVVVDVGGVLRATELVDVEAGAADAGARAPVGAEGSRSHIGWSDLAVVWDKDFCTDLLGYFHQNLGLQKLIWWLKKT